MSKRDFTRVVILLSGGIDSFTVAGCWQRDGAKSAGLFVDYGQLNMEQELEAAQDIARYFGFPLIETKIEIPAPAALTGHGELVPTLGEIQESPAVVPWRNSILISLAAALAETRGASEIAVGFQPGDSAGFWDCRIDFVEAWNQILALRGMVISAPLIHMDSKSDVIEHAKRLRLPMNLPWSCYTPVKLFSSGQSIHCGRCDACVNRREAFSKADAIETRQYAVDL